MNITPGNRAKLKGTDRTYTVQRIFTIYPDQPQYRQEWAKLLTEAGGDAFWLVEQLEAI